MENAVAHGALALPTIFILLNLIGALLALVWRRTGISLALISSLLLYASATPALSSFLLAEVEAAVPRQTDLGGAQAIVVLGGDVRAGDGAEIADRLGPASLERVRLAARAYRELHLPVVVTGGRLRGAHVGVATLMKAALEEDFTVAVTWTEDDSRTTWEDALYTARLLLPEKITTVVLVSQTWHLPRARWAFERVGFKTLPWPASRTVLRRGRPVDFLPGIVALHDTYYALHELIGGAYYRLRY